MRSLRILAALFSILALLRIGLSDEHVQRPNVIVILTDDQGYGDMSCHGNPFLNTPELDRLHDDCVRLTDFHVDPTCAPTRAALLTGRYSTRTGVWLTYASRNHLRRDEVTMAEVFRQNGYRTAIYGKWHLGENYPFHPIDRGFDESLIHGGGVVGEAPDYWNNNYYDDVYLRNGKPEKVEGYCTDVWFNETISFIEENRNRPFFVYLSTNAAHAPFHVPERYSEPYADQKGRSAFYGMIANIDENVGKLREYLQESSLERNTILIFLNDNGTSGGVALSEDETGNRNGWEVSGYNAGMRGKKTSRYEGGHRAACFIRWPDGNLMSGRDVDELTAHIDLLPTLIDLCDLQYDGAKRFDGASLAPILTDPESSLPERSIIVHDQGRFNSPVGEGELIKYKDYAVMRGKWRLVGEELYDLQSDPGQGNDISDQHPETTRRLRQDYDSWWTSVSDRADEYCPFIINPAKQEVGMITSQSLLGGETAYSQRHVRSAMPIIGWTVIDVETPGLYRISLRRWPRESGAAIRETLPPCPMDPSTHRVKNVPCVALNVVAARLMVGNYDKTLLGGKDDEEIVFEVDLPAGEQRIQTWFTMENGEQISAYYTYIEPLTFE